MLDYIINNVLVVTAIISFIGVSCVAIINYICNVRVNKAKINHEERKLINTFLLNSFDNLRAASKELREMKVYKNDENPFELMSKLNDKAHDIFDSIKPFISKEKRDCIEKQYSEVEEKMSMVQIKSMMGDDFNDDDINFTKSIIVQQTKLRHELYKVVNNEISLLAEKIKKFQI